MNAENIFVVTEGPTDLMSALDLGFNAIGRAACQCGGKDLSILLRRLRARDVIIIADNDLPGIQGAEKLSAEIGIHCCIYTPPTKDLRSLVQFGGTRSLIESSVSSLVWRNA